MAPEAALSPPLLYVAAAALGLLVGSFLNVVVRRLPVMMERAWREECREFLGTESAPAPGAAPFNLWRPGSRCPHCEGRIRARHNIPVLSYILLRGRCADCGGAIEWRYPLVEALTALLTPAVAAQLGFTTQGLLACLFTWALVALAFIDLERQLLPDSITLPLLWLGLLANYAGLFTDLHSALLGAALGYAVLWLVQQSFRLAAGKEGMGAGDLKLLAAVGAWCGWQSLATIILLSSLAGALAGGCLVLLRRRPRSAPIPFGPFLAAAGWLSLVWQANLFN